MSHHHHHHHFAQPQNQSGQFTANMTLNFTDDLPNGPYLIQDSTTAMRFFVSHKGTVTNAYVEMMRLVSQVLPLFHPCFTPVLTVFHLPADFSSAG